MELKRSSAVSTSTAATNFTKLQTSPAQKSPKRQTGPGGTQVGTSVSPKVDQTRKLLLQILRKLKKRKKPPSLFTSQPEKILREKNANSLVESGVSLLGIGGIAGGSDYGRAKVMEEYTTVFHTDETCELLFQLREVLVFCKFSGIIFGDRAIAISPPDSPYSSQEPSPTRSRSPSPTRASGFGYSDIAILDRIMDVLSDIVQNDCRYKVSLPRPSRPSYALQTIALDVAFLLIDQNPYSSRWLYELGMSMLSGFNTFEDGLRRKLLIFYGNFLLPQLIGCSNGMGRKNLSHESSSDTYNQHQNNLGGNREIRGRNMERKGKSLLNDFENSGHINIRIHEDSDNLTSTPPPPVAIEIHSPVDNDTDNHKFFMNNEYHSNSKSSDQYENQTQKIQPQQLPQISREISVTYKGDLDIEEYYIDSMFIPLLYSIVQYIDVQKSSLETIYQMHLILAIMIKQKPHLYYDIIEIIAYGEESSRAQAVNILFHFWGNSTGHPAIGRPLLKVSYEDDRRLKEELENHLKHNQHNRQNQNNNSTLLEGVYPLDSRQKQHQTSRDPDIQRKSYTSLKEHLHQFFPQIFFKPPDDYNLHLDSKKVKDKHLSTAIPRRKSLVESQGQLIPTERPNSCMQCFETIFGFGLRCGGCKLNVHFGCYNWMDGGFLTEYLLDSGIHKLSTPRFCDILANPRQIILDDPLNSDNDYDKDKLNVLIMVESKKGHKFHLVNLYTLLLCMICREPLWGITHQGYRCEWCNHFIHVHCLFHSHQLSINDGIIEQQQLDCSQMAEMTIQDAVIHHDLLRQTFLQYYKSILHPRDTLPSFAIEELSVMISVLEIQENLLRNGILAGCLIVRQKSVNHPLSQGEEKFEKFELHSTIDLYKQYFFEGDRGDFLNEVASSSSLMMGIGTHESTISQEYWDVVLGVNNNNRNSKSDINNHDYNQISNHHKHPWILFEEEYLGHLAGFMKSGAGFDMDFDDGGYQSASYLGVNSNGRATTPTSSNAGIVDDGMSIDMLTTNEMIRWVKNNLGFQTSYTSQILLQQMANLGFVERIDGYPVIFPNPYISSARNLNQSPDRLRTECTFPLPFGIESSSSVESLISAIFTCLRDINITINECGFLFLTRRCWPDPFLSRYTLERLMNSIIEWICCEDDKLLLIVREYSASGLKLPGVRDEMDDTRNAAASNNSGISGERRGTNSKRLSTHNNAGGGAYVVCRKMLKEKYVAGWLAAVHQIDPELFSDMVYCQLEAVEELYFPHHDPADDKDIDISLGRQEHILRYIIKLWTSGLLFSTFNNIFSRWLGNIFYDLKALQRIFPPKHHFGSRLSVTDLSLAVAAENLTLEISDPINVVTQLFKEGDAESLSRGLRWMELLVRGGVALPPSIFSDFLPFLANLSPKLEKFTAFMQIIWYQVIGSQGNTFYRGAILELVTDINQVALDMLREFDSIGYGSDISKARAFIRITLALTLHSYACPLEFISSLEIVKGGPQRTASLKPNSKPAKASKQTSKIPDPTLAISLTVDSSLIQCLVQYSKLGRLGMNCDIMKAFWGLCKHGSLISNKDEFFRSCIPVLLPSIWETLVPLYDTSSDITILLLLKLVWADASAFRSFVQKIFEDPNWEVRFAGLDNLYGLFSKIEEKFNVQWSGVFDYLGPIFSYFVACLWDKEEYVRSKASSYIRAMQQRHIRLAINCWESYFEVTNVRERTLLVKLMIRLNAQFPDWQVIEWSMLLNALNQEIEVEVVSTDDILDSYMRPDSILVIGIKHAESDLNATPGQKVTEEENLKVLLSTLALQMLGNGIEISKQTLIQLKCIVMSNLGFANCRLNLQLEVDYGDFKYAADDFSQNMMMITCLSNLKKILDTPIYLKLETEYIEDLKGSPELGDDLVGGYFVNVILNMFNSSIDMSILSHLMLKTWLELMLIIIYKHKIEDRRNKELEESIVNAMRRISELLGKDISDENKQLIIELSACLLKRSPLSTVSILGKQIITLGKLITKLKYDTNIPLVESARAFLIKAFKEFAKNGLFVLIFKNQAVADENHTELDMFRVLRKVIVNEMIPSEGENQEFTYLREQPIRDVMNRVFDFNVRQVASTILCNLNKYVQLVYPQPYGEQLIVDLSLFITKLTKHTNEWKRGEWDINPMLNMMATILKEHPIYVKILVPHIKNLFRHAIQKCSISMESCDKLLKSYPLAVETANLDSINPFGDVIIEELRSSFRGSKSRLNSDTMIILLQLILLSMENTQQQPYFVNVAENLFDDSVSLLENPITTKEYLKKEFKVDVYIGQLVVAMCNQKYDLLTKIFLWQKSTDSRRTIRLLNWVLMCMSKSEAKTFGLITTIFDFQDNIADLLTHALRQTVTEVLGSELNYLYTPSGELAYHAFLLIKIWTVLCVHASRPPTDDSRYGGDGSGRRIHRRLAMSLAMAERRFWNSIWPSMKQQLTSSIMDTDVQPNGIAYWEMFMDLITFLHLCGSDIVMLYSQEWCALLDSLTNEEEQADTPEFNIKIRQARAIFDDPPLMMSDEMLFAQLLMEMREGMRLYFEVNATTAMRFFGP
ncbi:hypothetical protein G9A89_012869 [Geosiphon pyriformis]|nr:hypothetical protein G9A89_012869 [Geosiphon pyriformis]